MADVQDHELIQLILTRLAKSFPNPPVPVSAIDADIELFRSVPIYAELDDQDWRTISRTIKSRVKITMEPGETISARTVTDWLVNRHQAIDWKRWVSYKQLLAVKGFPPGVLASLDTSTNEILNCMGDPTVPGVWKRRGLVIGDVQSGKTATYLGAINKAADAGYRLIILLAGGTEALRKQTQFRLDEGLLGRDTASGHQAFGVGAWHGQFLSAQAMTTQATDFRKTSKQATSIFLDPDSPTPLVFVLKKNKTALENVRDWVKSQQIGDQGIDVPMLLVDDESDYASVNTKDEDSPTVINSLIREILALVTMSSYLAFTATPFANVFIDHETEDELLGDDLFPSDYITTLDAPSNYVGTSSFFGTDVANDSSQLVLLDDAVDHFPFKHKSHLSVGELPESLVEALRTFVIATAIRESRGDSNARSMLVNVSRFKNVQEQVYNLVEEEFERIKTAVELHSAGLAGRGHEHDEIGSLRAVLERRFPEAEVTWPDVKEHLKSAVHNTAVRLINSDRVRKAKDLGELETDRMIAVGGDVLSRGLTLEGLTVSYFHRQVGASDTLLQMARWFGYRPGYADLCRVWIPDEVADQFRHVSSVVAELRGQLRAMKKQGLTPRDFGLAVRMHPESLLITARNKMRAAEAKAWTVNVAGARNLETTKIDSAVRAAADNATALRRLVVDLEESRTGSGWAVEGLSWPALQGVDKEIVADFLSNYVAFVSDPFFRDAALSNFIRTTSNPKLQEWLVAFPTGRGHEVVLSESLRLAAVERSVKLGAPIDTSGGELRPFRVSGNSSRLAGSTDVGRAALPAGKALTEPGVYSALPHPILLVYVIRPVASDVGRARWEEVKESGTDYLVGVKVAVPGKPGEKGAEVKYMLNSVALKAWAGATFEQLSDDDLDDLDGADDA